MTFCVLLDNSSNTYLHPLYDPNCYPINVLQLSHKSQTSICFTLQPSVYSLTGHFETRALNNPKVNTRSLKVSIIRFVLRHSTTVLMAHKGTT